MSVVRKPKGQARSFRTRCSLEVHAADGAKALLYSATRDPEFSTALLDAFARRKRLTGDLGSAIAMRNRQFRDIWGATHPYLEPVLLTSAEVHTSIRFGERFVLKILRSIAAGVNGGVEMGKFLTEGQPEPFPYAAPLAGHLEYEPASGGESTTLSYLAWLRPE